MEEHKTKTVKEGRDTRELEEKFRRAFEEERKKNNQADGFKPGMFNTDQQGEEESKDDSLTEETEEETTEDEKIESEESDAF